MSRLVSTRSALAELAGLLDTRRSSILENWRDLVAADPTLDVASDWSLKQFNDHFPDVLESLGDALRTWPDLPPSLLSSEQEYAVAHARARWIQGYSLRGVVREWGHFNAVVIDQIAAFVPLSGDRAVNRQALAVWARLFNDQQALSALEYHQLERAEAETRGAELSRLLDALRAGSQTRGRAIEALASGMRNDLQVVLTGNALGQDGGWHEAYQLRKLTQESFRNLEQALSDMVTLAHLEAGHEVRRIERFDAGQGLALLVDGLQQVAAAEGIPLHAAGPESMLVRGDAERVRRLAKHLLLCALHAPDPGPVELDWRPAPEDGARWVLQVEHAIASASASAEAGSAAGRALAASTDAVQQIAGVAPTGCEPALRDGRLPVAAGDGVDLLIAKHLCDLLGGGLEVEAEGGRLRYRVSLPVAYGPEH